MANDHSPAFVDPVVMTAYADTTNVFPETFGYRLKRLFLGRPFVSEQLSGERLNRPIALGVLAPDCISSSAYGTEEILTQMTPYIGLAAFSLVVPLMFVIIGVLFLVTTSYFDVIKHYTTAGGSYVVARDNFGPRVAQIAAVALLIDYIVTVAVQCSAGTAALTSAFPSLQSWTLVITVGVVLVLIFGNLRGIREAGRYFAFPTYFYVIMLGSTIVVGIARELTGHLHHVAVPAAHLLVDGHLGQAGSGPLMGLSFLVLLRAYANGGSSLTGLEAISNGVASFRRPQSTNARATLLMMSGILSFLLLGVTLLAAWTHALPYEIGSPTVVSQEVTAVFGTSSWGRVMFYGVQFATLMILYTGGNTSFNGFPFLAHYVASDRFLPRQLTKRGHRLAFSNGIMVLGAVALALIVAFDARLNALVALYAIGVFTGFAMAGSGLVARHLRERGPRWRLWVAANALSAVVTAIVVMIFLVAKFTEGAWIIAVVGPFMYVALLRLNGQYRREEELLSSPSAQRSAPTRLHRLVVFVDTYDVATERALAYCASLNTPSIRAVHFDIDPLVTKELEGHWGAAGSVSAGIPLEIADCEDRRIDRAALELVADIVRDRDVFCMVVLPRRSFSSRWQRVLHDRTADAIAAAITHVPRTSATIVPYQASRRVLTSDSAAREVDLDAVQRGARRESAHLEADELLSKRAGKAAPIGGLHAREFAEIAGRVRSMAVSNQGTSSELQCVLGDDTGSITLVFQGRSHVPGIERGTRLVAKGTVVARNQEAVILNPGYEIVALPHVE